MCVRLPDRATHPRKTKHLRGASRQALAIVGGASIPAASKQQLVARVRAGGPSAGEHLRQLGARPRSGVGGGGGAARVDPAQLYVHPVGVGVGTSTRDDVPCWSVGARRSARFFTPRAPPRSWAARAYPLRFTARASLEPESGRRRPPTAAHPGPRRRALALEKPVPPARAPARALESAPRLRIRGLPSTERERRRDTGTGTLDPRPRAPSTEAQTDRPSSSS